MMAHREQPSLDIRSLAERVPTAERLKERLLNQVIGTRAVAREGSRETGHVGKVWHRQFLERRRHGRVISRVVANGGAVNVAETILHPYLLRCRRAWLVQQLCDDAVLVIVPPLAEMMKPYSAAAIGNVDARPVLIVERTPN